VRRFDLLAKLLILPLPLLRLLILILIFCPFPRGRTQVLRRGAPWHGCRGSRPRPWMADGGGPPEQCRSEGMPSLGEAPNGGAEALWLLSRFSKVTRCKSETASRRYRRNGYVRLLTRQKKRPPQPDVAATQEWHLTNSPLPRTLKNQCAPAALFKSLSAHSV
jgi:hypothetical protein